MDWSTILQVLRDVLTMVGASKLIYEGYRQIKKTSRNYFRRQNLHSRSWLYKKVFRVRYKEQIVRQGLQKKSKVVGIPVEIAGIAFQKKASISSILSFLNSILFLKKPHAMIFHKNRMKYLQA